ncbi:MAG: DUF2510 domain-containing protein [Actinomycetota bacterium]
MTTMTSTSTARPLPTTDRPMAVLPTTVATARGWHADPQRQHDLRFHDGDNWTDHVTHLGPVPCRGCNPGRN